MQELVMTPSTIVLLVLILALAALAIYRMVKRGLCDCGDHCSGGCGKSNSGNSQENANSACGSCSSSSCKSCAAAEKMAADMQNVK